MRHIQVTDIDFGDIDARSEILARDPERRKLFLDSFYVPSTVSLHKLVAGDRYLLVGPKGSGKTAFLRYLQNHLAETTEGASRFIVFRDDVTEQDRDKLVSLSQVRIYENGSTKDEDDKDMVDCSTAWQLFIHREIAHTITKNPDLCGLTPEIGGYLKLVNQFFAGFKTHAFKRLIQRITKGKIRIAALGQGIEAEA
jgi:energy-coupling factor transporter ATP-binding protein EcfA2